MTEPIAPPPATESQIKMLFGEGDTLRLNVNELRKNLIANMLRVHIASIDKRLESCDRCPIICENPGGFPAEPAEEETDRMKNYPQLGKDIKLPYYEGLRKKRKKKEAFEKKLQDLQEEEEKKNREAQEATRIVQSQVDLDVNFLVAERHQQLEQREDEATERVDEAERRQQEAARDRDTGVQEARRVADEALRDRDTEVDYAHREATKGIQAAKEAAGKKTQEGIEEAQVAADARAKAGIEDAGKRAKAGIEAAQVAADIHALAGIEEAHVAADARAQEGIAAERGRSAVELAAAGDQSARQLQDKEDQIQSQEQQLVAQQHSDVMLRDRIRSQRDEFEERQVASRTALTASRTAFTQQQQLTVDRERELAAQGVRHAAQIAETEVSEGLLRTELKQKKGEASRLLLEATARDTERQKLLQTVQKKQQRIDELEQAEQQSVADSTRLALSFGPSVAGSVAQPAAQPAAQPQVPIPLIPPPSAPDAVVMPDANEIIEGTAASRREGSDPFASGMPVDGTVDSGTIDLTGTDDFVAPTGPGRALQPRNLGLGVAVDDDDSPEEDELGRDTPFREHEPKWQVDDYLDDAPTFDLGKDWEAQLAAMDEETDEASVAASVAQTQETRDELFEHPKGRVQTFATQLATRLSKSTAAERRAWGKNNKTAKAFLLSIPGGEALRSEGLKKTKPYETLLLDIVRPKRRGKNALWVADLNDMEWYNKTYPALRTEHGEALMWNDAPEALVSGDDLHDDTDDIANDIAGILEKGKTQKQLKAWRSNPQHFWSKFEGDLLPILNPKAGNPHALNVLLREIIGKVGKDAIRNQIQWTKRANEVLSSPRWQKMLRGEGEFAADMGPGRKGLYPLTILEIGKFIDYTNEHWDDLTNEQLKTDVEHLVTRMKAIRQSRPDLSASGTLALKKLRKLITRYRKRHSTATGEYEVPDHQTDGEIAYIDPVGTTDSRNEYWDTSLNLKPPNTQPEWYLDKRTVKSGNIQIGIIKCIQYQGSKQAELKADVARVNAFRARMGAAPLDPKIIHEDDPQSLVYGQTVLQQGGLENYTRPKETFDISTPDGNAEEWDMLQAPMSQQHGQPWTIIDELFLRDVIGQLECFLTWTHSPDWDATATLFEEEDGETVEYKNYTASFQKDVGAITFDTSNEEVLEKMKTHIFRPTVSRSDTTYAMHQNLLTLYEQKNHSRPGIDIDYMHARNYYCITAALDEMNVMWLKIGKKLKPYAQGTTAKSPQERKSQIKKLKKHLDETELVAGDFLNAAREAVVEIIQEMKKRFGWAKGFFYPREERMKTWTENLGVWQDQGPAETFGMSLGTNYRNPEPEDTSEQIYSPVDRHWIPLMGEQTDEPKKKKKRKSRSKPKSASEESAGTRSTATSASAHRRSRTRSPGDRVTYGTQQDAPPPPAPGPDDDEVSGL